MYKIIIEQTALNDLEKIFAYYHQQGGLVVAEKNNDRIFSAISSLDIMPNRCKISAYSETLHELSVERVPYKIFFKIDDIEKTVFITSVIHSSRNFDKLDFYN